MCNVKDCDTQATYNFEGLKKPIKCYKHGNDDGMVNVMIKKCIGKLENGDPCKLIASFGKDGIVNHCAKHIEDGETDLRHKKCENIDCPKQACCGIEGTKSVHFCAEHCPPEMINIKSNRCIGILENGKKCTTIASCNFIGNRARLYCIVHKLPDMIDIVNLNNLCKINEIKPEITCITRANFNKKGEKIALFCQVHASRDMVNVLDKRKCEKCNDKRPIYNWFGEIKGRFCMKDKEDGMINIFAKKCEHCPKNPIFNKPEFKNGLRCIDHKDGDMIDIRHKRCKTPLCLTRANKKFDMHCFYCFVNLFPNDERVRNYKTKEKSVADFIKMTYPNLNWIEDKVIKDGCSRRRPDLLLDSAYDANIENKIEPIYEDNKIIIIEIDENEHSNYESICENRRLMELSKDLNHRPLIVIKFNPDKYKKDGKNISSCWEADKTTGLLVIKKSKRIEWSFRLNELKKEVDKWIDSKTDKMLKIIKLFYTEN